MEQVARLILWLLFGGLALTLISSGLIWYYENTRRLTRMLKKTIGKAPDAAVFDLGGTKAAGLDFTNGDLAILWQTGAQGLVFSFDEIEGAELIVDERVVARAQKGEVRRVLEETHAQASKVTLRLMFADTHTPEFELNLFGDITNNPIHPKTAAEAVRLGRKWLSHVDAVIKRQPKPSETRVGQAEKPSAQSDEKPYSPYPPAVAVSKPAAPAKSPDHVTNDTLREDLPF